MIVPNIKKIAILRANALGDFIVTLPAIHALRAAYPQAELTLLAKPWHKEFLTPGRTPIDRVIVIPITKGIREEKGKEENPQEIENFFKEMQKENFDIAIHFHGNGMSSNPFIKKLGAKMTVGLTSPEAEPLDLSILFYYYQSEVIRYLEVVSLIGAPPTDLEPQINILENDNKEAEHFLKENKIQKYLVMHPCAMDIRRMWPEEKFAEAADILIERGYKIIFSGSESDVPTLEKIQITMKNKSLSAAGKLSLGGLAALLTKSECVISSDTGPLHLARAVGAKTVGIYWAPNLINWGPLTRQNHQPAISWKLECPNCGIIPNNPYPFEPYSTVCHHNYSFVKEVSVEEIIKHAMYLTNNYFNDIPST